MVAQYALLVAHRVNSYHIFDFKRKKVYDNKESDKYRSFSDLPGNVSFRMWKNRSNI